MAKANEALFNAYVSEEFRKSAEDTKQILDTKINAYVAEFRRHIDTVVSEIKQTDYSSQFKHEAEGVIKQAEAAGGKVAEIEKITADLEAMAPALTAKLNQLKQANAALKYELDGIHDKANQFGSNVGKFVASGVKQVVTGGLPIF